MPVSLWWDEVVELEARRSERRGVSEVAMLCVCSGREFQLAVVGGSRETSKDILKGSVGGGQLLGAGRAR